MNRLILILLLLSPLVSRAQQSGIEIISDTSSHRAFHVYVNGIQQTKQKKNNAFIKGMPLEVYQLKVAFTPDSVLRTMAFLQLGKIRNYLVSQVNGAYFLTEGPLTQVTHPNITDTIFYQTVSPETIVALEEPLVTAAFDDSPKDTANTYLTKPAQVQKEEPIISPAQQQALERLTYKPIMGEDSGPDCFLTLLSEDLNQIKTKMLEENSQQSRLNFALTFLNNKCLTIEQLKRLMRSIEGDELKLDFYSRVRKQLVDPENKSDLAILLDTESALQTFIKMP